ncbi:uncharacterized protein [Salminus brasiliensis]|uniref:uncharacterized protein isoform X2 n=1 Tax=Salminus brasiliensis TaxID=930266 RepID=UPI003B82FE11
MEVLFFLLILAAEIKGLQVEGPSSPLVVQLGGAVVLPCSAQNPLPQEGLRVEWSSDSGSVVNVFQQNEIRPELQSLAFRGRANFFPDQISRGNFSILLSNITGEDAGVYRCQVYTDQDSSETTVEIKDVERLVVTGAHHAIITFVGEEVILNCSIDSHIPVHQLEEVTWTKHPDILVLLFQENETLSESSHERYQGRAEFFTSEIPGGNFSLRLKDVRLEDKGEFICKVHAADLSAQTTVIIQQIGPSSLQKFILVLCFISFALALGLGVPVFIFLQKEATTRRVLVMYILAAFCPNICMFIAFVLWSTEGLLSEVLICAAVSFARCLILMKTAPYLNTLPERLVKEVKSLGFPLYCSIIITAVFSAELTHYKGSSFILTERILMLTGLILFSIGAVISAKFALRISSFLFLVQCNGVLLAFFLHADSTNIQDIVTTTPSVFVGMILLLTLQRHFFQQKPFKRLHIGLTSAVVAVACMMVIGVFIFIGIYSGNVTQMWRLPFMAVIFIILWITLVCLVRRQHNNNNNRFCAKWRGLGYMCCAVLLSISVLANGILYLHFIREYMRSKEIPHITLYMFGASGLSIVTSLTLGSELILKAGTAERTLPEMYIIILPFECLFVLGWLALQIYSSWMRMRGRIKRNFEDEEEAEAQAGEGSEEMEVRASLTKTPES